MGDERAWATFTPCPYDPRARVRLARGTRARARVDSSGRTRGRTKERPGARLAHVGRVHELSLVDALCRAVAKEVGGARVHRVQVRIGTRAAVSLDALRFCFEVCTRGTALADAVLDVVETESDELVLAEIEVS